MRRVYVGSLGTQPGGEELRRELARYLAKNRTLEVVHDSNQADAVFDGKGELWVRGYHSLSPRARANMSSAEAVYTGYLSVKLHGKDGEVLWSYFADPPRIGFRELNQELVREVGSHLLADREAEVDTRPPTQDAIELPASLRGAGATFPFPIYQAWFKSFHAKHPTWDFVYSPVGSDEGVSRLAARSIDFAGSDIPPGVLKNQISPGSDAFPTVGGAVVLIYNLPGFAGELRLTPEVIGGIFSGKIQSWDDPALLALNPAGLPSARVQTVHRSDGSGTTFALTDYLGKTDKSWPAEDNGSRLNWTNGKGVNGNEALSQAVASTPYSVGYTEFIYAFDHHLNFAAIRNQAGRFIQPDLLSIMAAANGAGDREEYLGVSITNSSAANAYPISTFSWLLVRGDLQAAKKTAAAALLEWIVTSGQRECSALGYAPLPRNLIDRELKAIRKLK